MDVVKKLCLRIIPLIAVVAVVVLAIYVDSQKENGIPTPLYGQPATHSGAININEISMDQIANDETYLYILDQYNGKLYVFDLEGTYQYTLLFLDYMNGAFHIAVTPQALYVKDPKGDVYCYQCGELVAFFPRADAIATLPAVDFECNSDDFYIRPNGVYRKSGNNEICIIKRNVLVANCPAAIRWALTGIVVGIVGFLRFRKTECEDGPNTVT